MVVVVSASLLLTLLLPSILRRFACEPLGIRCAAGQAKLRPRLNLTSDLVVQNITILEQSGPEALLRARRFAVTIDLLGLIRARGVMPTEVRLDRPELSLRRLDDGRWNVMALAETVRQRLRPTTGAIPFQLPRILVTSGEVRVGANQVKGLDVSLEPRSSPLLFEAHVRAAAEGKMFEANLVVRESLEGDLRVAGQKIAIGSATRPWEPRAAVSFHVGLPARKLTISEWRVEDQGMMAHGTGVIDYAVSPPAYRLSVEAWRLDLAGLAEKLPLPVTSGLEGQVRGEPVTLRGRWPEWSISTTSANLTGVAFHLPKNGFRVTGMRGTFRLQQKAARLRLQTELRGEALELYDQRHAGPALKGAINADLGNGDLHLEELVTTAVGLRLRANGIGRRWGRDGWDLHTTELTVEPKILTRLFHRPEGGVAVEALRDPSISFRWPGGNHPWSLGLGIGSITLAVGTTGYAARLGETKVLVTGNGIARDNLKGTVISRETEFGGRTLSNLIVRFEIHPDQVQMPEFRFSASGGTVQGQLSFSRPSPLTDLRATLSARTLRIEELLPATARLTAPSGLALDADLSAAISKGQISATLDLPPTATRQLIHHLNRSDPPISSDAAKGHNLTLRAQGALRTGKGLEASGTVTIQGLRTLLAGHIPADRELPVTLPFSFQDGRVALTAQELNLTAHELAPALSGLAGLHIQGRAGSMLVSARAMFGGRKPPSVTGEIEIRGLSLDLVRKETAPAPFLRRLRGSLAFALDQGMLTIKETALRDEAGLTLMLGGGLPIGRGPDRPSRFHLTLPSTEMSSLRTLLAAFTPTQLANARYAGQIQGDLELTGRTYHGTLVLRAVGLESNLLRLEGLDGTIPLAGGVGQASGPARTSTIERIGSGALSEEAYEKARRGLLQTSKEERDRHSLTVASMRYGPIELRDLTASLAPDSNGIGIRHFAFQSWGGKADGWGTIDPLRREATLDLLIEGLSLQAICDAFPPIRGYISGKINGLAHLSLPGPTLDKAQGGARFWAVNSPQERKEISRTLIEKLAGQRIRYFNPFGQDRRYDRGVLDVSLKRGDLVFHELDISHSTLGIKDLDIKVSPSFNKIGVAHLIESIIEAAERIKASGKPTP
ncbi:MAG: hypothetical protein ACREJ6_09315 [Candidatus Methylomirabilis sp.]